MPTAEATTSAAVLFTTTIGYPFLVKNQGPATVFLNGVISGDSSSVTADQSSTGGYPLHPGEVADFGVSSGTVGETNVDLYGVTAEGSAYVSSLF